MMVGRQGLDGGEYVLDGTDVLGREGRRGKPGLHALLDQRPFELGERAEDVEHQLSLRSRGVHLLGQAAERDARALRPVTVVNKVWQ